MNEIAKQIITDILKELDIDTKEYFARINEILDAISQLLMVELLKKLPTDVKDNVVKILSAKVDPEFMEFFEGYFTPNEIRQTYVKCLVDRLNEVVVKGEGTIPADKLAKVKQIVAGVPAKFATPAENAPAPVESMNVRVERLSEKLKDHLKGLRDQLAAAEDELDIITELLEKTDK